MGIPDDQIKNAAVASEAVDMDGTAEATDRADDVDTQDGLYLIGGDHCGGLTPELRAGGLFRKIVKFSDPDEFTKFQSPQFLAFQWLINEDERKLCPSDSELEIDQRYVLAVLYYSMFGDLWPKCGRITSAGFTSDCGDDSRRFLSGSDVCEWNGVICNDENHIVRISVSKMTIGGFIPQEVDGLPYLSSVIITRD